MGMTKDRQRNYWTAAALIAMGLSGALWLLIAAPGWLAKTAGVVLVVVHLALAAIAGWIIRDERGTSGGIEVTDDLVKRLADEAERGYDLSTLRPRKRGDEDD
ncbi:MAG TPA: hypothetical protein VFX53_05035 [Pedococcus sp.]|nr:hypothetical protein [Pedococcus sp.]